MPKRDLVLSTVPPNSEFGKKKGRTAKIRTFLHFGPFWIFVFVFSF